MSAEERQQLGIHAIPVFLFYFEGRLIDKIVGADIALVEEKLKGQLQKMNSSLQGPTPSQPVENTTSPQMYKSSIRSNRSQPPNMYDGPSEPNPYGQPGPMYNPYQSQYHQYK
jgi:hypothetical protein